MSALVAEALGTFLFLLIILCVLFRKDPIPSHAVPIVIGVGLLVSIVVASGLNGSGHLNPVVSMVMGLNGQISSQSAIEHIAAQVVGAALALAVHQNLVV